MGGCLVPTSLAYCLLLKYNHLCFAVREELLFFPQFSHHYCHLNEIVFLKTSQASSEMYLFSAGHATQREIQTSEPRIPRISAPKALSTSPALPHTHQICLQHQHPGEKILKLQLQGSRGEREGVPTPLSSLSPCRQTGAQTLSPGQGEGRGGTST